MVSPGPLAPLIPVRLQSPVHLRVAMKPSPPPCLARVKHGAPMHSTPNPKQADPREILVAPEDKELSSLAHDAMRYSSDPQTRMGSDFSTAPPVDTGVRPAAVNNVQGPR